jgi:hypothetical protein
MILFKLEIILSRFCGDDGYNFFFHSLTVYYSTLQLFIVIFQSHNSNHRENCLGKFKLLDFFLLLSTFFILAYLLTTSNALNLTSVSSLGSYEKKTRQYTIIQQNNEHGNNVIIFAVKGR